MFTFTNETKEGKKKGAKAKREEERRIAPTLRTGVLTTQLFILWLRRHPRLNLISKRKVSGWMMKKREGGYYDILLTVIKLFGSGNGKASSAGTG